MLYELVSERQSPSYRIKTPDDAFKVLSKYSRKRVETFLIVTLNGAHEVIATRIVSLGLVNRTLVHPREVFYRAIKDNAVAIILAHNHPSGNLEPSDEDREVTSRMVKAGELLGIPVLDHVIISRTGFRSIMH